MKIFRNFFRFRGRNLFKSIEVLEVSSIIPHENFLLPHPFEPGSELAFPRKKEGTDPRKRFRADERKGVLRVSLRHDRVGGVSEAVLFGGRPQRFQECFRHHRRVTRRGEKPGSLEKPPLLHGEQTRERTGIFVHGVRTYDESHALKRLMIPIGAQEHLRDALCEPFANPLDHGTSQEGNQGFVYSSHPRGASARIDEERHGILHGHLLAFCVCLRFYAS